MSEFAYGRLVRMVMPVRREDEVLSLVPPRAMSWREANDEISRRMVALWRTRQARTLHAAMVRVITDDPDTARIAGYPS
jgi:hypothetical protein